METTTQNRETEEDQQLEAPVAATSGNVDPNVERCWICHRNELELRKFMLKSFLSLRHKDNERTPLSVLTKRAQSVTVRDIFEQIVIDFEHIKMEVPVCLICRSIGYSLSVSGVTLDLENLEEQSDLRKAVAGHIAFAVSSVIMELRELKKKVGLSSD